MPRANNVERKGGRKRELLPSSSLLSHSTWCNAAKKISHGNTKKLPFYYCTTNETKAKGDEKQATSKPNSLIKFDLSPILDRIPAHTHHTQQLSLLSFNLSQQPKPNPIHSNRNETSFAFVLCHIGCSSCCYDDGLDVLVRLVVPFDVSDRDSVPIRWSTRRYPTCRPFDDPAPEHGRRLDDDVPGRVCQQRRDRHVERSFLPLQDETYQEP